MDTIWEKVRSSVVFVMTGILGALSYIVRESLDRVLGILLIMFINTFIGAFIWTAWNFVVAPEFGWIKISYLSIWIGLTALDLGFKTVTLK